MEEIGEIRKKMNYSAIIYNYFYRLSELTFLSYPVDYHLDAFWQQLTPYQDDTDEETYDRLVYESGMGYQSTMNKIKAITIILYKNGPAPAPVCIGDVNDDGVVNVGDVCYLVTFLFKGGPAPLNGCD